MLLQPSVCYKLLYGLFNPPPPDIEPQVVAADKLAESGECGGSELDSSSSSSSSSAAPCLERLG